MEIILLYTTASLYSVHALWWIVFSIEAVHPLTFVSNLFWPAAKNIIIRPRIEVLMHNAQNLVFGVTVKTLIEA